MRSTVTMAAILIAMFAGLPCGFSSASSWACASDQDRTGQVTVRVPVRLVAVDAIVTGPQNESVANLRKEDFQIFDNGRRQEIRHFKIIRINVPVSQAPILPPPPRMPTFGGQDGMPDIARPMDGPGINPCSPEAAAAMKATLMAALEEKMAKASDTFARASLTAQTRYQLGYYPEGEFLEGQYRHIEVRVNRPGMKVVSREGYFVGDTLPAPEIEEPIVRERIAAAVNQETDLDALPFKITTGKETSETGQAQIRVDLQIDATKVGFKTAESRHLGRLRIAIFYADDKGRYLGENWQTMNLQLEEEAYRRVLRAKIPFSTLIPAKSSKQILRVVIYDVGSDRLGSKLLTTK